MTFTEYRQYDALGLAELVRKGDVTPTELAELAIARAEAVNPAVNAIIEPLYGMARSQAQSVDTSGPFAGVPFLLKDLGIEIAGTPLRCGSASLAGYTSPVDSFLVERFRAAGFLFVGKTNTPEFGLTPYTEPRRFGPTRNPWNTGYTAGGSSGGSAAGVAAGIAPMATASDGGGSIRIPAANCGLFGLKPSRGRLSLAPYAGEKWSGAVVEGCNSRSVRDTAAFLDAFAGPAPGELYYAPAPDRPYRELIQQRPATLRIGFSTQHTLGHPIDPECEQAINHTVRLLQELGHTVEEVPLPFEREDLTKVFLHMIMGETGAELRRVGARTGRPVQRMDVEPNTFALALLGDAISASDFAYFRSCWNDIARRQANFHGTYDLLLTPTVAKAPFPIGALQLSAAEKRLVDWLTRLRLKSVLKANIARLAEQVYDYIPYTPLANMTGQPAMSVPLYWTERDLPVGVMFTAALNREDQLLSLAAQLEEAQPWFGRVPEIS
ncbi:MAG: amidase [Lewinella sp.]|nr:amidase [Lewinella sp.]